MIEYSTMLAELGVNIDGPERAGGFMHSELGAQNPRLISASENALEVLLGRETRDYRERDLLGLRANLRVFELPTAYLFSVYFPEALYIGEELLTVLNLARSRKDGIIPSNQGVGGASADWILPDQTGEGFADDLIKKHQSLKGWADFINNDRHTFMAALLSPRPDEVQMQFSRTLGKLLSAAKAEDLQQQNINLLKRSPFQLQTYSGSVSVQGLDFQDLPEAERRRLIKIAKAGPLKDKTVVDPSSEPVYLIEPKRRIEENGYLTSALHLGNGLVDISCETSWVLYDFKGIDPKRIREYKADMNDAALIPWVVWVKDKQTGHRTYLMGDDLPGVLYEGVDSRANRRLGLLLATALSDEQRDKLPREMALKPGGFEQRIAEAQIPLLVDLFQKPILRDGEFFQRVEGLPIPPNPLDDRYLSESQSDQLSQIGRRASFTRRAMRNPITAPAAGLVLSLAVAGYGIIDGHIEDDQIANAINSISPTQVGSRDFDNAQNALIEPLKVIDQAIKDGKASINVSDLSANGQELGKEIDIYIASKEYPDKRKQAEDKINANREFHFGDIFRGKLNRKTRDFIMTEGGLIAALASVVLLFMRSKKKS